MFISAAFLLILQFFTFAAGQDMEATLTLDDKLPGTVRIVGRYVSGAKPIKNFGFIREYAGVKIPSNRFNELQLYASDGSPLPYRRSFDPTDYRSEGEIIGWSYAINLSPLNDPFASGHVSWLSASGGILFLDDILPQTPNSGSVRIRLVNRSRLFLVGTASQGKEIELFYRRKETAVIPLTAEPARIRTLVAEKESLAVGISGEWNFQDQELLDFVSEIFGKYRGLFGGVPSANAVFSIRKFPIDVRTGNYEADTRGNTVSIISSDLPFRSQSSQRLHEQLRHESFHLWIPNGVNLTGRYDWFYEGFALYQSLKLGVGVGRIRFDDYLDTLSRAWNVNAESRKTSLIDESRNRWIWIDGNTTIYARGILVAFLCDLAMLEASKGKRSTDDILREVYSKHSGKAAAQDGNTAILAILRQNRELVPITERFITGSEKLDWNRYLQTAGLEAEVKDQVTRLKVTAKPSGRQKDLLDKLGYNSWRKLAKGN